MQFLRKIGILRLPGGDGFSVNNEVFCHFVPFLLSLFL